ncbi:MAG: thioesterase, partial [Leptolyngbyaceae cyanobacterium CRU_2_3]|nr:thioesterase [Leptolyngbyaceae cyanobacterium CRU_2_3]
KPFACLGTVWEGLVSFELARLLRQQQQRQPIHLFISAHRAAQIPDPDPPIHALPDPQFLAEIRRFNGTPEAVLNNTDLMQLLLPTLRADFTTLDTYRYVSEPPLNCPITALGGLQDPEASYEELAAWQQQTTEAFSLHRFPGDHFFLHPSQPLILQLLGQALLAHRVTLPESV